MSLLRRIRKVVTKGPELTEEDNRALASYGRDSGRGTESNKEEDLNLAYGTLPGEKRRKPVDQNLAYGDRYKKGKRRTEEENTGTASQDIGTARGGGKGRSSAYSSQSAGVTRRDTASDDGIQPGESAFSILEGEPTAGGDSKQDGKRVE